MLALLSVIALGASPQVPSEPDRRIIAEAQAIVRRDGDLIWAGLSQAQLPVLLIGAEQETLFCGVSTEGFSAAGFDPITRCSMQVRAREEPVDLAAAADLGGVSVIMMGLPAALEATQEEWIVTFLHEAFHQYQSTLPGYVSAVDVVRTQLGQTGGQWMLDYAFPYSDPKVKEAFAAMTSSAARFLDAENDTDASAAIRDYVHARHVARDAAGASTWLYYEFQVGQEGVALWTEMNLASTAGTTRPDLATIGRERSAGLTTSLRAIDSQGVHVWKRSVFYVLGAVEASMLERVRPQWQQEYAVNPFSMGSMLDASSKPINEAGSP
jgi:hypothetical protein